MQTTKVLKNGLVAGHAYTVTGIRKVRIALISWVKTCLDFRIFVANLG